MLKYHRVVQLGGIRVCFQAAVPIWSRMKCFYSVIWSRVGSVTNKNTQGTIKDFTRGTQRPASFLTYSPLQNYWSSKASSLILIIKTMNSAECLLSVLALCFASADCINKLNVYNVKTRELFIGEKWAILILIEDWKSIRAIAQTLSIASTTIWNVLKKTETTGVLSRRRSTGRHRKQQLTKIVRDWVLVTKKYRNKAHKFWDKVLWTDETKMSFPLTTHTCTIFSYLTMWNKTCYHFFPLIFG